MTTSYLCCSSSVREYSALSPNAGREFRECSMVAVCSARCCNCYRCILQTGRVSLALYFTPPSYYWAPAAAWHGAAAASRSFLTEPCSALLRRNTKHTDMRQRWWFSSFHQVIILKENCCKQWRNKARDRGFGWARKQALLMRKQFGILLLSRVAQCPTERLINGLLDVDW